MSGEAGAVPGVFHKEEQADFSRGLPPARGPRDVIFAVLYYFHIIAMVCAFVFFYIKFRNMGGMLEVSTDAQTLSKVAAATCGVSILFAVLIGTVWLLLARHAPRGLIYGTLVSSILFWAGMAGYGGYLLSLSNSDDLYGESDMLVDMGVRLIAVAVGFMLVAALCLCLWRQRIPFAAIVLQTTSKTLGQMWGTFITTIFAALFGVGWYIFILCTVFYGIMYLALYFDDFNSGACAGIVICCLFSVYWTVQVVRNTAHTITSGAYATWYFLGGNMASMPANPTLAATRRALTTSFGSICLGSLIVALLQTLRAVLRALGGVRYILFCLQCILYMFEKLMQLFNKYAFTQIAIYGKSFCEASKDTFVLLERKGIHLLIQNVLLSQLISFVLVMTGVVVYVIATVILAKYVVVSDPVYEVGIVFGVPPVACLLTVSMLACILSIIDSGATTLFVAYAMDPQALQRNDPVLFREFESRAALIGESSGARQTLANQSSISVNNVKPR